MKMCENVLQYLQERGESGGVRWFQASTFCSEIMGFYVMSLHIHPVKGPV